MLFRARELREGSTPDDLRRQMNEAFKLIERDLTAALTKSKVSSLITDATYSAAFGEVVRVAPPSTGTRLILPEPNLAQLDSRITAVQEAATGPLSVEVVNGTINGATTLSYLAGIGTVEFVLTSTGWYAWSGSLVASFPLTGLASQASDTFVGNVAAGSAVPTAVGLSTLAGAGLAFAAHTLDVTVGNAMAIVTDAVAYTGSTSRLVLTGITGNQGTVDISTLSCGGHVFISGPTGNWQIEAFSTKPAGFWFNLAASNAAFTGTLFNEDATPTAALRLRCNGFADAAVLNGMQAMIFRNGDATGGLNRWSCVV
jgi:hypothetical protein